MDEARQVAVCAAKQVTASSGPLVVVGWTLEFDGQTWTLASSTHPWSSSSLSAEEIYLTYHGTHQRVESVSRNGEIRSWNGSTWTPRVAPVPGFIVSGACFDTHRSRLVVLGHFNGSGSVLEYDTNYGLTQLWAGPDYPATIGSAVYDEGRRKIVCTTQDTPTGPLRTRAYEGPSGIIATWSDLGGSTVRPTPRNDAILAVDDSRGAILFGGRDNNNVPNNETWLWDSRDWTNLQPTTAPAPRSAAALAGKADRVVLFGGMNSNNQAMGDTWALVGSSWQQLSPLTSPPARFNHAMATNYASGETYLFGGSDGQNWFGDVYKLENFLSLWSWNQVQVGGTGNVGARDLHAIAIDERRNKLVLFGGRNEFFQQLGDTWELDLSQASPSWTQRVSAQSPSGRVNHGMTYDRQRERIVLVGGYDMNTGAFLDDIWEWDGVSWAQRTTVMRSIVPTENPAMAYDHRTQRVVLFGGWTGSATSDNTYELVETAGPAAPGQQAPVSLILSSAPTVNGINTTPLGVDIASSAGLSALFVAIGGAPQPLAYLPTPLFCSSQPFYVQPVASYVGVGNRFSYSVPIPPAAAGMLLSAQGLSFHANGCIDTTDALFVTVQTLQ
jgi:hypothetical protein